jgi:hypothetical protein
MSKSGTLAYACVDRSHIVSIERHDHAGYGLNTNSNGVGNLVQVTVNNVRCDLYSAKIPVITGRKSGHLGGLG